MKNELKYKINNIQNLSITAEVYHHIVAHRQLNDKQEESGGQLFAYIDRYNVNIIKATGPNKLDKRGRFSFLPSIFYQRQEIQHFYCKGLHYVGDWHTHPEVFPKPSRIDIYSMQKAFQKSQHDLQWFIMIIVGQDNSLDGLSVNLINHTECIRLYS